MRFYFTAQTRNKKLGPMPVVTASKDTCPLKCKLLGNSCYAQFGPLGLLWQRLENEGLDFKALLRIIRRLGRGVVWRYGQAGDLPPTRDDKRALAEANAGRPVICFTHDRDIEALQDMNRRGFVTNLSADSVEEADILSTTGLPVVVVLPSRYGRRKNKESLTEFRSRLGGSLRLSTPSGRRIVICPETYHESVTCSSCRLCTKPRPHGEVIGFPAHGPGFKTIDRRLEEGSVNEQEQGGSDGGPEGAVRAAA